MKKRTTYAHNIEMYRLHLLMRSCGNDRHRPMLNDLWNRVSFCNGGRPWAEYQRSRKDTKARKKLLATTEGWKEERARQRHWQHYMAAMTSNWLHGASYEKMRTILKGTWLR